MQNDLQDLEKKIQQAKKESSILHEREENQGGAMRFGIELVAGVTVGAGIGYFADKFFGTSPIFFLIFFILGTLGGFANIYRLASAAKTDNKSPE